MRRSGFRWAALIWIILVLCPAGSAASQAHMSAHFFYVGQAEAVLLKGPDFAVLVDAGDVGRYDVVPLLRRAGVEELDVVIITHPHGDHMGQLKEVVEAFPVKEVWMSEYEHPTPVFEEAIDALLESTAGYYEPRAGERIPIGSLVLEILNPLEVTGDIHGACLAVRAVYDDFALVLTGDIEVPTEEEIVKRGADVSAQVLQLGHHGSQTSTGSAFLEAVNPEVAVYSAGICNPYGHPHISVVQRILQRGITLYGTDAYGTIVVETDGTDYWISTERVPELYGGVFGQIEINRAPYEELLKIVQIGAKRAGEILRLRPFSSLDDLLKVPGIGPATLEAIKAQGIAFVGE